MDETAYFNADNLKILGTVNWNQGIWTQWNHWWGDFKVKPLRRGLQYSETTDKGTSIQWNHWWGDFNTVKPLLRGLQYSETTDEGTPNTVKSLIMIFWYNETFDQGPWYSKIYVELFMAHYIQQNPWQVKSLKQYRDHVLGKGTGLQNTVLWVRPSTCIYDECIYSSLLWWILLSQ